MRNISIGLINSFCCRGDLALVLLCKFAGASTLSCVFLKAMPLLSDLSLSTVWQTSTAQVHSSLISVSLQSKAPNPIKQIPKLYSHIYILTSRYQPSPRDQTPRQSTSTIPPFNLLLPTELLSSSTDEPSSPIIPISRNAPRMHERHLNSMFRNRLLLRNPHLLKINIRPIKHTTLRPRITPLCFSKVRKLL